MKVTEVQKSHFNLGYRALVSMDGSEKTVPTKWFTSYNGLRAALKHNHLEIPTAGSLRWMSNGFDASCAFV